MKLYLTIFNTALLPINSVLYSNGLLTTDAFITYSMLSVFSVLAMYIIGNMFRRFVGRVYISDDRKYVRLSHLTFFGNRVDDDIDREDIVPLVDSNQRLDDWFCTIERYSSSSLLYISLKFDGIVDISAFESVFGEDSTKFSKRF